MRLLAVVMAVSCAMAFAPMEQVFLPAPVYPDRVDAIEMTQAQYRTFGLNESWHGKINSVTGLPYQLIGRGLSVSGFSRVDETNAQRFVEAFVRRYRRLIGVGIQNLTLYRAERHGRVFYITLWERLDGISTFDSRLEMRVAEDGRVFLLRSTLIPPGEVIGSSVSVADAEAVAREYLGLPNADMSVSDKGDVILPMLYDEKHFTPRRGRWLELKSREPLGNFDFIIGDGGDVLLYENTIRTVSGNITGQYYPYYMSDPVDTVGLPYVKVWIDSYFGYADRAGHYSHSTGGSYHFTTKLEGTYCNVNVDGGTDASVAGDYSDAVHNFCWTTSDARDDEINLYYHTNVVHNYVKNQLHYNAMDYQVPAAVNDPVGDNAYWDGTGINFGAGSSTFYDLALFCDVIYHEYTHGVTHHIYPGSGLMGDMGSALDEGFSDYFACAITEDPYMGEEMYIGSPSTYMRTLVNSMVYPTDYIGEGHHDSQIMTGAMWSIRERVAPHFTMDSVAHNARFGFPETFEEELTEYLTADDSDGDITNGTNHGWDVLECFYAHGIGPGALQITHTPLSNTDDTIHPYEVNANVYSYFDIAPDSVFLYYNPNDSGWVQVPMSYAYGLLTGFIPARGYGEFIKYYIYLRVAGRAFTEPSDAPSAFHYFFIEADTIPPTITHTPPALFATASWGAPIWASVTDNHSLTAVYLDYKINGLDYPHISMLRDGPTGLYYGYFDGSVCFGDTVDYQIEAVDASLAHNTTYYPSSGYERVPVTSGYIAPVAPDDPLITTYAVHSGFTNEWHIESARYHGSDGWSFKCGGDGTSDYSDQVDGALELPPVTVSGHTEISFYYRIDAEISDRDAGYAWDGGIVETALGTSGWTRVAPTSGEGYIMESNPDSPFPAGIRVFSGSAGWTPYTISLDGIEGDLSIRFHFGSDAHVTDEGWYIDDIVVTSDFTSVNYTPSGWVPKELSLAVEPNPFNPVASVSLRLPTSGDVRVAVYDINGKRVALLKDGFMSAGVHTLHWDGSALSSGLYLVSVRSVNSTKTIKAVIMR